MSIVFVHGRDQQGFDPDPLRQTWLEALARGAERAGLGLTENLISESSLPYYARILVPLEPQKRSSPLESTRDKSPAGNLEKSIDAELALELGSPVLRDSDMKQNPLDESRGPVGRILARAGDRASARLSLNAIRLVMKDVVQYLVDAKVRSDVDRLVIDAIEKARPPRIVVAHSLGSVVAYHSLAGALVNLEVERLVTLGSPLGVLAIVTELEKLLKLPLCRPPLVKAWINAADRRDIVALNPNIDRTNLFRSCLSQLPRSYQDVLITNFADVRNDTDNHHGIIHYLDDPIVAASILHGLS
ncbi:hypothetical protein N2605_00195 [Bradyrhizobium yuanmingense]|uniref:hypothetical protein n=1 Tax=Bradyrhizobium yuanmingense TaxID=108015 RepID=UPI0021A36E27|nr:hypothetical protein [Bradyrhizobium sp. CB1024]UWU84920.1 hypothetical protein N2605_00195 [Bradyrhizobium sp. CB1024]